MKQRYRPIEPSFKNNNQERHCAMLTHQSSVLRKASATCYNPIKECPGFISSATPHIALARPPQKRTDTSPFQCLENGVVIDSGFCFFSFLLASCAVSEMVKDPNKMIVISFRI
jgi:hypothetical protein